MFTNPSYQNLLSGVCSLTRLYSESEIPYLSYRIAENIFCKCFNADNLARKDSSYDAKLLHQEELTGVGLKTFQMKSDHSLEKVAEFNAISDMLRNYSGKELAIKVAGARNRRIRAAQKLYQPYKSIYHCVGRGDRKLYLFETSYDSVDMDGIRMLRSNNDNIVKFKDGLNEYSYNISKSTLYQRFLRGQEAVEININILDDPFDLLAELFEQQQDEPVAEEVECVILPLYSTRYRDKRVAPKSGLNQWNAGGRARDDGEVYIPIPRAIHHSFPDFFPARDQPFSLKIPTGEVFIAKVCQDNSKALMTNPNKALSDWLLKNVLELEEGELATREKLDYLGFDSVVVEKIDALNFTIDIKPLGSFEKFIEENDQE